MGCGAIIGYGSDARSEGAEAVVCIPEYIVGSKRSSSNWYRFSRSCRDREMYSRCIDSRRMLDAPAVALAPFGMKVNSALPWKVATSELGAPQPAIISNTTAARRGENEGHFAERLRRGRM